MQICARSATASDWMSAASRRGARFETTTTTTGDSRGRLAANPLAAVRPTQEAATRSNLMDGGRRRPTQVTTLEMTRRRREWLMKTHTNSRRRISLDAYFHSAHTRQAFCVWRRRRRRRPHLHSRDALHLAARRDRVAPPPAVHYSASHLWRCKQNLAARATGSPPRLCRALVRFTARLVLAHLPGCWLLAAC